MPRTNRRSLVGIGTTKFLSSSGPEATEDVRNRHADHQVGVAELPLLGPRRHRRELAWIALGCTLPDPILNPLDLLGAQPAFANESSSARVGLPWRHRPSRHGRANQMSATTDVVVVQQAKGAAWPGRWQGAQCPRMIGAMCSLYVMLASSGGWDRAHTYSGHSRPQASIAPRTPVLSTRLQNSVGPRDTLISSHLRAAERPT